MEHLKTFLQAWLDWVESGAPDNEPFSRGMGLCGNIRYSGFTAGLDHRDECHGELKQRLYLDSLDEYYPFNTNSSYDEDSENCRHYLNQARIQWVRETIKKLQEV